MSCVSCGYETDTPNHELGCGDNRSPERRSKDLADSISHSLGWQGARPEYFPVCPTASTPPGSYSGSVILIAKAAAEVDKQLTRIRALNSLKRKLRGDADQLYAEAETVIPRYRADKRLQADAVACLLEQLP
jgi:hypothetical protein